MCDIRSFFDTESRGEDWGGTSSHGRKRRLFSKMPLASCIIEIYGCFFFAVRSIVGFSVSLQVDVCLNPGNAESWQSTLFHSFLLALILTTLVDFSFPSTSHAKAMCLQNVNSCVSDC